MTAQNPTSYSYRGILGDPGADGRDGTIPTICPWVSEDATEGTAGGNSMYETRVEALSLPYLPRELARRLLSLGLY